MKFAAQRAMNFISHISKPSFKFLNILAVFDRNLQYTTGAKIYATHISFMYITHKKGSNNYVSMMISPPSYCATILTRKNFMKSARRKISVWNFPIALKFVGHLDSTAIEAPMH